MSDLTAAGRKKLKKSKLDDAINTAMGKSD